MSDAPRKSFTTTFVSARNNYAARDVSIGITNGREAVSLVLKYTDEYAGVVANMPPDVSRQIAAELIARADEIEGNAKERARWFFSITAEERAEAFAAIEDTYAKAEGDSNDDEIASLQEARDILAQMIGWKSDGE